MIISNDLEDAAEKAVAVAEIYSQATKVRTSEKGKDNPQTSGSLAQSVWEQQRFGDALAAASNFKLFVSLSPSLFSSQSRPLSLCLSMDGLCPILISVFLRIVSGRFPARPTVSAGLISPGSLRRSFFVSSVLLGVAIVDACIRLFWPRPFLGTLRFIDRTVELLMLSYEMPAARWMCCHVRVLLSAVVCLLVLVCVRAPRLSAA